MADRCMVVHAARVAGFVGALVCATAGAVAAETSKDLIVGKWWAYVGTADGDTMSMEFTEDGTYRVMVGGQTSTGTYTFPDEGTMETRIGQTVSQFAVTASSEELILTQGTARSNFHRVKEEVAEPSTGADRHE